jgi:hypothetical protein
MGAMSYLNRIATQSRASFQPRAAALFTPAASYEAEEAEVEVGVGEAGRQARQDRAAAPASSPVASSVARDEDKEPQASRPAVTMEARPAPESTPSRGPAPSSKHVTPTEEQAEPNAPREPSPRQASVPARSLTRPARDESPDDTRRDTTEFVETPDGPETSGRVEPQARRAARSRGEGLDPAQVNALLERIAAIREASISRSESAPGAPPPRDPLRDVIRAEVSPERTRDDAQPELSKRRLEARPQSPKAEYRDSGAAPSSRQVAEEFDSRRVTQPARPEPSQVTIGSIVVRMEPEPAPPPRPPPPAASAAKFGDNRWARSFLDR